MAQAPREGGPGLALGSQLLSLAPHNSHWPLCPPVCLASRSPGSPRSLATQRGGWEHLSLTWDGFKAFGY